MNLRIHHRSLVTLLVSMVLCGYGLQASFSQPVAQVAYDNHNILRLHVLAHSDSPADQDLKLAVRDALIPVFGALASQKTDVQSLEEAIHRQEQTLLEQANRVIHAAGRDYPVRVEVGEFTFPTKSGPSGALPAGDYRAVRVVIGEGAGRNWWCVLFPPLCVSPEARGVPAVTGTKKAGTQESRPRVQVRLRMLPDTQPGTYTAKAAKLWRNQINRLANWGAAEARTRNSGR